MTPLDRLVAGIAGVAAFVALLCGLLLWAGRRAR